MYQTHWGLRETPFRTCLDRRFFYQSPTHEEALARLHFLVDEHRRLGLLIGEPGSGKSLLLDVFADELRRDGRPVALVNLQGLRPEEMLWSLAVGFGLNPDPTEPLVTLWRIVTDRLAEYRYFEQETAILLDDAGQASADVIAQLTRLASWEYWPQSRLTVVAATCREGLAWLGRPLLELAELRIDVEPWEEADTVNYLRDSLTRAGRRAPIFDEPAIGRLHQLAGGIPRRITQLADLALMAGAGRRLDHVDAETVESVYRELGAIEV